MWRSPSLGVIPPWTHWVAWIPILPIGLVLALVGVPLFWYRHYVVDGGEFPEGTWTDLIPKGLDEPPEVPCSIIPKVCICLGIVFMLIGYIAFYVML